MACIETYLKSNTIIVREFSFVNFAIFVYLYLNCL